MAGIYSYRSPSTGVERAELARITDAMAARGPDGRGEWYDTTGTLGLGHRRLSIIDVSERGAQPMVSADGRYVISFNGEIYNFRQLRAALEREGAEFRSTSDTEVLLALYTRDGKQMVTQLRGMFAFAIWDTQRRELFCARDPYGIKPFYYSDTGGVLRFASSVKALRAGGRISHTISPAGRAGFYLLGSVPEPWTWFEDIRILPAGHWLLAGAGGITLQGYDRLLDGWQHPDSQATFNEAVRDSVQAHLVADVPVGLFLSSGVDSCSLLALMTEAGYSRPLCITLAFAEFRDQPADEAVYAREMATARGARHEVRYIEPAEIAAGLPAFFHDMDQPSIDGLNTWLVSRVAHEAGLKVALSGLGGDELLGGYPSFADLPRWVRRWGPLARLPGWESGWRQFARLMSSLPTRLPPKALALPALAGTWPGAYLVRRGIFMPWELGSLLGTEAAEAGLAELNIEHWVNDRAGSDSDPDFTRVGALESSIYMRNQLLRDADWAGMAHSLEIRTPLVDRQLLGQVGGALARQPQPNGKQQLAQVPATPLPASIVNRPKTGFGLPMNQWLAADRLKAHWQSKPLLARRNCHWSRRWAHVVASEYGMAA